jgi:hypothetical protein
MKKVEKKTKNLNDSVKIKELVPNYYENTQLRQIVNAINEATIPFKELIKTKVKA